MYDLNGLDFEFNLGFAIGRCFESELEDPLVVHCAFPYGEGNTARRHHSPHHRRLVRVWRICEC